MWENTEFSFGIVAEGAKIRGIFKFIGDCLPQNVQLIPSCGCTDVAWVESTKEVHVGYVAAQIPRHLTENFMLVRKSVKIIYLCNGVEHTDFLYINGEVRKDL